jgi:hypothetical protein
MIRIIFFSVKYICDTQLITVPYTIYRRTSVTYKKRTPSLQQTAQSRELAAENFRNTPFLRNTGKGEGKGNPRKGHEGPDGE